MARESDLPSLAGESWLKDPRLQKLLRVLNAEGEARVAGGAVRNALLGFAVADVDVATTVLPKNVMRLCGEAGMGVHPTGLDHGTITVTVDHAPFEVTTLRKDVETDGRRAVVAFTKKWDIDAARRDFTMNALYCDADGKIFDFTNGYEDILKRRVRFVGIASERIEEDHLRILRFFRFHACYGKGAPDKEGLAACERLKAGLTRLSAERIRQELLKLLEAPGAVPTLKAMAGRGIFGRLFAYTECWRLLRRLPPDGLLRLFAFAKYTATLKDTLRLSNEQAKRLEFLFAAPTLTPRLSEPERKRLLYTLGSETWADAATLSHAQSTAPFDDPAWVQLKTFASTFVPPTFPVSGRDLVERGVQPGPEMGRLLRDLEDWWLASDFKPGKDKLLQRIET